MIFLRKPLPEKLRRLIESQRALGFTYPSVGATKTGGPAPAGYVVDETRVELGRGSVVFERAKGSLRQWVQFRLGWLEAYPEDTPIRAGETVVVLARVVGLWWTNAARIVYTIDEPEGLLARSGFAYGTLPGHVESGEERFLIEWDRKTDQVWYSIRAFSRPRHVLTRLGYPFARAMQKQFAKQSAAVMKAVIEDANP